MDLLQLRIRTATRWEIL